MNEIGIEEVKQIELNILKEVAAFCKAHDLSYFLAYGTLIGAVRHKGFIPWDDDIDIHMPRKDYNKLIKLFNSECSNKDLKLIAPNDEMSRHSIVKIIDTRTVKIEKGVEYGKELLGVDIDVFPLDGEPDDEKEYEKFYNKLHALYGWHLFFCSSGKRANLKRKLAYPILKLLFGGKNGVLKRAARLHQKYPYENSNFIGAIESSFNFRGNRYRKEDFAGFLEVPFEDAVLRIPVGYDRILTAMYGDYMQLPPEEKQVAHHRYRVFWRVDENEKV